MRKVPGAINFILIVLILFTYTSSVRSTNASPPGSPLITRSSVEYYNSTHVFISGNLTIDDGETIVFDNAKVIFNGTDDDPDVILVKTGGELIIKNGSLFTNRYSGMTTPSKYHIECMGNLTLIDSNISYAGSGEDQQSGLMISDLSTCEVKRSEFYSCMNGLYIRGGVESGIYDCIFNNCSSNGIEAYAYLGRFEIMNCSFQDIGDMALETSPQGLMTLSKFTNNRLDRCKGGFRIYRSFQNSFIDNVMNDLNGTGFHIEVRKGSGSPRPEFIKGNTVRNASIGIKVTNYFMFSEFHDNEMVQCTEVGASLDNIWGTGGGNDVSGNTFKDCGTGLYLEDGEDNTISRNLFINNSIGLNISKITETIIGYNSFNRSSLMGAFIRSDCSGNVFFRNQFNDNSLHARDDGSQEWDRGERGNFWSGLPSYEDLNDDGIVDDPYWLDNDSVDRYPLVVPWGSPENQPITIDPIDDQTVQVGDWLNLTFSAYDPDGDEATFEVEPEKEIDFILNNRTGEFHYMAQKDDIGSFMIVVNVTDNNGSRDSEIFLMTVKHRNYPPAVEFIPDLTILPGERKGFKLNYSDPNGDDVSVRIEYTDTPFAIDINSYDFLSFEPGPGSEGTYSVTLNFSDNNGTFTLIQFRIHVLFTNNPPLIVPIPNQNIEPGREFNFQVNARDEDPDTLSYSLKWTGNGFASIDGTGFIRIRPEESDIGNQTVIVTVNDNNGSVANETFQLYVYPENLPPTARSNIVIDAEAGDVMRVYLEATDPEDRPLAILGYDIPDFVEIDEGSLSMVISPRQEHKGYHEFRLYFMDDWRQEARMNVTIKVRDPKIPTLEDIGTIVVFERETYHLDLDWGYGKNGTVWFDLNSTFDFIKLSGSLLTISPFDGDHGDFTFQVSYGILNTSDIPAQVLRLIVHRNLSTLWIKVSMEPDDPEFRSGDLIEAELRWGGYNSSLNFQWVWEVDGLAYERCSEKFSMVYTNISGNWNVYIILEGAEEPVYSRAFVVKEKEENRSFPWAKILFNFIIGLIIIAAGVWGFLMYRRLTRYREEIKEIEGQAEPIIPEGFRSGPAMYNFPEEAREQVFSTEE